MRDGADMVLMGVGDHQAQKLVPPFGNEGRIGHDHIGFRQFVAAEANAAIDGQIFAVAPVKVEIHANLARPAQGQEGQFAWFCVH